MCPSTMSTEAISNSDNRISLHLNYLYSISLKFTALTLPNEKTVYIRSHTQQAGKGIGRHYERSGFLYHSLSSLLYKSNYINVYILEIYDPLKKKQHVVEQITQRRFESRKTASCILNAPRFANYQ